MANLRTAPYDTDATPPGLPYIIVNEAAERFSFVGMRTILVVFMTEYMVSQAGLPAPLSQDEAKAWFHAFAAGVYFFPLFGSVLADAFLGKYRTIYWLSIVYCLGHLALALDGTSRGLAIGLTLIAVGSGGIKPCVSAHLGDQFGARNAHRIERMFTWFYFAINIGSVLSTLATPWLLRRFGPHVAFGVPGALMLIATIVFRSGRNVFVHRPPGGVDFLRQTFSRAGLSSVGKLFLLYAFVSVFWALYTQSGSAWVLQAKQMDRVLFGIELLPAQVQAVDPLFTLALIPLSTYVLYPVMARAFEPTPNRRIGLGMGVMVLVFGLLAWIEHRISAGAAPTIAWHLLGFLLQSLAEVLVAVTCIEISYKRAPVHMKSLVMAVFALSVSLGNIFTSAVNFLIVGKDGTKLLQGSSYYLFFAGVMALGVLLYAFCARWLDSAPASEAIRQ
jgi:POT family proton-dependent oligopeptide transporter